MVVLLLTDLEAVAGVVDKDQYTQITSIYYMKAKRLLTEETNAAIRGFFDAGATKIYVLDGHGPGAIDIEILDERALYCRNYPSADLLNNKKIDAVAFIGQHSKAETDGGHMCHTGNFIRASYSINGISVGEFGRVAISASTKDIPTIFASGDLAFTREANELCPGIETVYVKEGISRGTGHGLNYDDYYKLNTGAIHLQPKEARRRIYEGSKKALVRYQVNKESFHIIDIKAPFNIVIDHRSYNNEEPFTIEYSIDDFIELNSKEQKEYKKLNK